MSHHQVYLVTLDSVVLYHHRFYLAFFFTHYESQSGQGVQRHVKSLSVTYGRSVVFSGSSVNKTDRHDITEIVLKVALNTIIQTYSMFCCH